MTCDSWSTSIPRAAMSVAISTRSVWLLNSGQSSLTGILRFVAMYGFGAYSRFCQGACQFVGAVFGTCKIKTDSTDLSFSRCRSKSFFSFFSTKYTCCAMVSTVEVRSYFYFFRIGQHRVGQSFDFRRHSGGEEKRLSFCLAGVSVCV